MGTDRQLSIPTISLSVDGYMGRIFCFVSNAKSKVDEPSTLSRDYIGKHRLGPFGNVTLGFAKEQCRKQTQ